MFTGIIEVLGCVRGFKPVKGLTYTLEVEAPKISKGFKMGGSLSVNGACLSLVKKKGNRLFFNVINETKKRTMFNDLKAGDKVNLERPLKFNGRVEGHFVLGHVDCLGEITRVEDATRTRNIFVEIPGEMAKYVAEKGSITIDGVSLTIARTERNIFSCALVPFTLEHTMLAKKFPGDQVNIEYDILAKYVEKIQAAGNEGKKITAEWLRQAGF